MRYRDILLIGFGCIIGVALVAIGVNHLLKLPLSTIRETQEARAERKLLQEKSAYLEEWQKAKLLEQRLKQQQSMETHWLFKATATLGRSVLNLWFVWVIALIGTALFLNRHRLQMQVDFEFNGLRTMLPQPTAERLATQAITALSHEAEVKALAFREDLAHQRLKDDVSAIRTLKGLIGKEPEALVDITPESLPAFTGPVYLSQCRQDGEFDENAVCWGRNVATGGLVQLPFDVMQSLVKNGLQGQGKSAATLLEIYAAWYQKYILRLPVNVYLIDKHHGFDQSLSNRLEAMLPGILSLFDATILGPDIDDRILEFLQEQIDDGKRRQEAGTQAQEPVDVIIFDEYTETVSTSPQGKAMEEAVKTLFNYRKAKKYLSLILYETTKNRNSVKGLGPAKLGASKMCFACAEDEAGRFIGWSHAKAVEGLDKGQCAVKLTNTKEVELVQLAIAGPVDFFQFAPFISPDARLDTGDDDTDFDDAETDQEVGPELTPDFVKAWIEERRAIDPKYSQNKLANEIGFSKKDMSLWMNGKQSEPKKSEMETALEAVIFGEKDRSVIDMKQWQKRRRKPR